MELLGQLSRWARFVGADAVVLRGTAGQEIEIRPTVQPIPRLRELVAREIGEGTAAPSLERLTTCDGELGAIAHAESWAIAVIVMERHARVIIGRGANISPLVAALAEDTPAGVPALRRRRFVYAPPHAWIGLARYGATRWLHPAFATSGLALVVFDATPRAETSSEAVDRVLVRSSTHGRSVEPPYAIAPTSLRSGLCGAYTRIDHRCRGVLHSIVRCEVRDERFEYTTELHGPSTTVSSAMSVLETLVETIEPLPPPRQDHADEPRVIYWGD